MHDFARSICGCWLAMRIASRRSARAADAEPKLLPQELLDEGWIQLFDGETLFGWQPTGDAKWEVDDGEVCTDGDEAGLFDDDDRVGAIMSCTSSSRRRRPPTAASSCGRRSSRPIRRKDCYELNIAPPDNPFPTGSFVGRQKATLSNGQVSKPDEWHTFDVTADGGTITVVLDGEHVLEYGDPSTDAHRATSGCKSKEGPVAFRNIRLRPLGSKPLFNGRILSAGAPPARSRASSK